MKIRNKMLIIVSITMVIVVLFIWIVIHTVLMSGFHKIEYESAERDVKRMIHLIDEMIKIVESKSADWAIWDDTYKFVIDHNQNYIESNLTEETLGYLKIDLLLIVDNKKTIVSSMQYDQKTGKSIQMSEKIKQAIVNESKFYSHSAIDEVTSGVIFIDNKPLIIVSHPILNSNGLGPIHGSLIFGQFLGDMEIKRLQEITHMSITVQNVTSCDASVVNELKPLFTDMDSIAIKPLSETRLAGYTLIKDIKGKPALVIRIDLPRDIHRQGTVTKFYLIFSIIIATAILCFIISILLERIILSRIYTLNADVNAITKAQDHSRRVKVNGKDEITNLSSSVNQMLSSLQKIETEIKKKNQELSIIMDSVPIGLLCLDENFVVNPEHSKSALQILEFKSIAGKNYFDILGINNENDRNKLLEFFDVFLENRISEKEIEFLNPFEEFNYRINNYQKWLRLRYFLVNRDENHKKRILVVIENITEEKALAEKIGKSEKENIELKAIAEDPDLFKEFLLETSQIFKRTKENIDNLSNCIYPKDVINNIFRDIHTLKGTASSFGLITVSEITGLLEEDLAVLRENAIHYDTINHLQNSLNQLSNAIMEVKQIAMTIFGEEFNESNDFYLRIPLKKLKYHFTTIKQLLFSEFSDHNNCHMIIENIDNQYLQLRSIPAKRGIAKTLKIVPELMRKLNKSIEFDIKGAETLIDCEIVKELNTPLIHLIRNCAYHGIESSEERLKAGKSPIGHITISFKESIEKDLIIEISDDGKGMDADYLKKVAIKKGLLTERDAAILKPNEAISLILRPGFSTVENITEISGRGVGMDAVAVITKEKLRGELLIRSCKGAGTVFSIRIPTRFV